MWVSILQHIILRLGGGVSNRNRIFRNPNCLTNTRCKVFHDPLVSLNFEGFDPQIFLIDPQNLFFTFCNSYEGGHCDPLNRKLRENPLDVLTFILLNQWSETVKMMVNQSVESADVAYVKGTNVRNY